MVGFEPTTSRLPVSPSTKLTLHPESKRGYGSSQTSTSPLRDILARFSNLFRTSPIPLGVRYGFYRFWVRISPGVWIIA